MSGFACRPLPAEVRAAIVRLLEQKVPVRRISRITGVSDQTIKTIAQREGFQYLSRQRRQSRPLYDPLLDGVITLDNTGILLGDPQPGRRELVAKAALAASYYDNETHTAEVRRKHRKKIPARKFESSQRWD